MLSEDESSKQKRSMYDVSPYIVNLSTYHTYDIFARRFVLVTNQVYRLGGSLQDTCLDCMWSRDQLTAGLGIRSRD